ncbi:hypothetical protein RCL_jg18509.t1 [Rhizophagus clarus]|uniref:Uncharacterized protein n=1 Tax=Rhizophagus clarus TaxID=94130 RepID=A0A8H3LIL4_9GLOM|nr:hypothetical protein RCL_jg18509.t1 [Rhizophagus clarus]
MPALLKIFPIAKIGIITSASQIIVNKILNKDLLIPDPSIDPIKYSAAEKVATTIKAANKNNNSIVDN